MSSISLNIDGIKNVKSTIKQVIAYVKQSMEQLEKINLTESDEIIHDIKKVTASIDEINICIKKYDTWIDNIIEDFTQAEIANENVVAHINVKNTGLGVATKKSNSVIGFSNVGRVVREVIEGGKSAQAFKEEANKAAAIADASGPNPSGTKDRASKEAAAATTAAEAIEKANEANKAAKEKQARANGLQKAADANQNNETLQDEAAAAKAEAEAAQKAAAEAQRRAIEAQEEANRLLGELTAKVGEAAGQSIGLGVEHGKPSSSTSTSTTIRWNIN